MSFALFQSKGLVCDSRDVVELRYGVCGQVCEVCRLEAVVLVLLRCCWVSRVVEQEGGQLVGDRSVVPTVMRFWSVLIGLGFTCRWGWGLGGCDSELGD